MTGQRKKRKKCPTEVIQTATRTHSGITVLFPPLNQYFVSPLSVFVGILFCEAEGPGPLSLTTGLVARNLGLSPPQPSLSLWLETQDPLQAFAS